MFPIDKDDFINMKKNGIFVFHSFSCWTCSSHIKNLKENVGHFYTVEYEMDVDYFESIGVLSTPTTIVYENNINVFQKSGMFFETQINEMMGYL